MKNRIIDDFIDEEDSNDMRKYVKIKDPTCATKEISIRKSTFVWLLTEGSEKLSKDRLLRVQGTLNKNENCQQMSTPAPNINSTINVAEQVSIGNWCIFKYDDKDLGEIICIGLVCAFKFIGETTVKAMKYSKDTVNLKDNVMKKLEVLSSWYVINTEFHLVRLKDENHFFIKLENYIATVIAPKVDLDTKILFFDKNDFNEIEKFISNIIK